MQTEDIDLKTAFCKAIASLGFACPTYTLFNVASWLVCHLSLYRYDVDGNHFIDFMELKLMMEKLGEPQTHIALKEMIKVIDEDNDGCISFREV